jgi:hypothetical protein
MRGQSVPSQHEQRPRAADKGLEGGEEGPALAEPELEEALLLSEGGGVGALSGEGAREYERGLSGGEEVFFLEAWQALLWFSQSAFWHDIEQ